MSIAPTETPNIVSSPRWLFPIGSRPMPDPSSNLSPPDDTVPSSGGVDQGPKAVSLSALIAQLSRQLRSIEQTFMRALQLLARNAEAAGSDPVPHARTRSVSQAQAANPYDGLIRRAAQRNELDPALLRAVIHAESGFDPKAVSNAGAMGLMQLMPDTAKSLGVADPYDPSQNVQGGARMLRGLIDRYGGRLDLALAAYNAGSGAVDKFGGIPPFAETRNYVHAIMRDYRANALGA